MPDLLSTVRRQVPSDPVEHKDGSVGVSSRWWYLAQMYKPIAHCGRCIKVPSQEAAEPPGKKFAESLREATYLHGRSEELEKTLTARPVSKTGELYVHDPSYLRSISCNLGIVYHLATVCISRARLC